MEEKLNKTVDDLVTSITSSKEFMECMSIKEKMDKNLEIKKLVNSIKKLQKKYVRTMDDSIKTELDSLEEELGSIPLYSSYKESLEKVNQKIDFIKESLNDYFYTVVNPKKRD